MKSTNKEISFEGEHIKSNFSMEPGTSYGLDRDSYFIEVQDKAKDYLKDTVAFESFEKMKEFSKMLSRYVESEEPDNEIIYQISYKYFNRKAVKFKQFEEPDFNWLMKLMKEGEIEWMKVERCSWDLGEKH